MRLVTTAKLSAELGWNDVKQEREWIRRLLSALRNHELRVFDAEGMPAPHSDEDFGNRYFLADEVNVWLDRVAPASTRRLQKAVPRLPPALRGAATVDGEGDSSDSEPGPTDAELATFAKSANLTAYEFERLTGYGIGPSDLFVVSQDGVWMERFSDEDLKSLTPSERQTILEAARHRLLFPCAPSELVSFVEAVSWRFGLPAGFAELVRENNEADFGGLAKQDELLQAIPVDIPVEKTAYGPERDRAISERCCELKSGGVRNFLKQVAIEYGVHQSAIKQARGRHQKKCATAPDVGSTSLFGQLKAAKK